MPCFTKLCIVQPVIFFICRHFERSLQYWYLNSLSIPSLLPHNYFLLSTSSLITLSLPLPPYLLLNEFPVPLLYQFVQCTAWCILHGYHQRLLFNERQIVSNNVWTLEHRESVDFIIADFLSSGRSSSTEICFITMSLLFAVLAEKNVPRKMIVCV